MEEIKLEKGNYEDLLTLKEKIPFTVCHKCFLNNFNRDIGMLNNTKSKCPDCPLFNCIISCDLIYCKSKTVPNIEPECIKQGYLIKTDYNKYYTNKNKRKEILENICNEYAEEVEKMTKEEYVEVEKMTKKGIQNFLEKHKEMLVDLFINDVL